MATEEVRLECLKLAASTSENLYSADDLIASAQELEDFVDGAVSSREQVIAKVAAKAKEEGYEAAKAEMLAALQRQTADPRGDSWIINIYDPEKLKKIQKFVESFHFQK